MKNKFLALLLCLAMLVSMLTCLSACSKTKNGDNIESNILSKTKAKTLTLWIVTENKKTAVDKDGNPCFSKEVQEAMDSVEKAFSKITKTKYKTNVDIQFLTADEYYGKLEHAIAANTNIDDLVDEAARALSFYLDVMTQKMNAGEIPYKNKEELTRQFYIDYPEHWPYREGASHNKTESGAAEDDETFVNEWGIREVKYPDAEENQVDIFYFAGQDNLINYIENQWLVMLDSDLAGVGAVLSDYIAPALLQGVKHNGITYAIPNNIAIGEYTYMFIDKEMYDGFGYGGSYRSSLNLVDCKNFLDDVAANSDVLPIASTLEETMSHFVWYWNVGYEAEVDSLGNTQYVYPIGDGADFSVFGALYGDPANASRGKITLGFNNLMTDPEYQKIFKTLKTYDINGYYGTPDERGAAISYVKGDYSIKGEVEANDGVYTDENGKEYYVSVVKYPEVGDYELYGNMLGVCSASKYPYACVQILTALNTNSELRNILQYGIEGEHYTVDEETGVISRIALNDAGEYYSMDIEKTGNCFVAHPEEGYPANYWEKSKLQNGEAVVNPLLGFDFAKQLEGSTFSSQELKMITAVNDLVLGWMENANDVEDLEILLNELSTTFGSSIIMISSDVAAGSPYIYLDVSKYTNPAYEDSTGKQESPYTVYYNWVSQNAYLPLA